MKKNKNKKFKISNDIEFLKSSIELLLFEIHINEKKLNHIELNSKELFFDNLILKPSIILRALIDEDTKGE